MTMATAGIPYDDLLQCMRCGFCLQACPTFELTGREANSPRGRIALVRAAADGLLSLTDIVPNLDLCLGCRACEPACPAGVRYGHILESARAVIEPEKPRPSWLRLVRRLALAWGLGTPAGIRLGGWGLWLYQRSGLAWLVRKTGLLRRLGGPGLAEQEEALPPVPSPLKRLARRQRYPAKGEPRLRVAFFTGCVMDMAFWEANEAAIRVLQAAGCEVVVPPGQGCCGAVHSHAGEHDLALAQARRNIQVFLEGGYDYVVNAAGGCGAALKEYGQWLAGYPEWAEPARRFSAACKDFNELLATLPLPAMGPVGGRVTYQDSCHLRNVQKVVAQPRALLKAIPGLEYVELPGADRCCGAAGTYSISQPETAGQIQESKMDRVRETGANLVTVVNAPCHLHLRAGLEKSGLAGQGVRAVHIAELLDQAIQQGPDGPGQ